MTIDTTTEAAERLAAWHETQACALRIAHAQIPARPDIAQVHDETAVLLRDLAAGRGDARNGAVAASECAGRMMEDRDAARAECEALTKQVARLRDALWFYTMPENAPADVRDEWIKRMDSDRGKAARAALAEAPRHE
jgi:hypothetical protein